MRVHLHTCFDYTHVFLRHCIIVRSVGCSASLRTQRQFSNMAPKTYIETIERHEYMTEEQFIHHRAQKDYISRDDSPIEWARLMRSPEARTDANGTVRVLVLLSRKRRVVSEE